MNQLQSFPPIAASDARVLLLGSMPGKRSLDMGQYYAHPQNTFWPIMGHLFTFDPCEPYPVRVAALTAAGIAVWDVMKYCSRKSSLDADIIDSSIVPNDFQLFLDHHVGIKRIFFNGLTAEKTFLMHVKPTMNQILQGIPCRRLPSTSPAHASLSFTDKMKAWSIVARNS